jgi:dipeptidyl-peptidase-3
MARAGVRGLEFYDPANKKHGQAHMQARYENSFEIHRGLLPDYHMYRLGITQFLIKGGLARP